MLALDIGLTVLSFVPGLGVAAMTAKVVILAVKIVSAISKIQKVAKAIKTVGSAIKKVSQVAQRVAAKVKPSKKSLCSFAGDTGVLMADGSTKPIEDVQVGDQVQATDPETGEEGARTVTHLWVHFDTLTTFSTDAGDVVTTEDHPFWNATDQAWQGPQEFNAGDTVLTAGGALVAVGALDLDSSYVGLAYNLTVDDIHTYYVEVGTANVLVHNTGLSCELSESQVQSIASHAQRSTQTNPIGHYPNKSLEQVKSLVRTVVNNGKKSLPKKPNQSTSYSWNGHVVRANPQGGGTIYRPTKLY